MTTTVLSEREQFLAIREGHLNAAAAQYFGARPQLDNAHNQRIFYAGHCAGYDAALASPPPSEPVAAGPEDMAIYQSIAARVTCTTLTDERINDIFQSVANDDPDVHIRFARAILADHAPPPSAVEPVVKVASRFNTAVRCIFDELDIDVDETTVAVSADGKNLVIVNIGELQRELDAAIKVATQPPPPAEVVRLTDEELMAVLPGAVRKMHAAKGRYHTQLACCELYDLMSLSNVKPGQEAAPSERFRSYDMEALAESMAITAYETAHPGETSWSRLPPGECEKWRAVANNVSSIATAKTAPVAGVDAIREALQQGVDFVTEHRLASKDTDSFNWVKVARAALASHTAPIKTTIGESPTVGFDSSAVAVVGEPIEDLLSEYTRAVQHGQSLFDRCQGKVCSDADSAAFTTLRDETIPALRKQILATQSPPAPQEPSLERYLAANYPDAEGDTAGAKAISALEKMDIALGMAHLAAQPAVPGYVLVPVEPTPEMCLAAAKHLTHEDSYVRIGQAFATYVFMLKAAPTPPKEPT